MRSLLLLLVLSLPALFAEEEGGERVRFAPAIILRGVEWWGPGADGAMWWWAGKDGTPHPSTLGRIREGDIFDKQEIDWLGRTFTIDKVVRTAGGSFEVTFEKWRLVMGKTHEDRWLVDVFPPDQRFVTGRFRTVTKATAHLDGGKK
jgi:hypothetical protein